MTSRRTVNDMVAEAKARIEELSVDELQAEIERGGVKVVDIRDVRERIDKGTIPGAISAPRGMLEFWFCHDSKYFRGDFEHDDRVVLYCAGGGRSALAADVLGDLGYTNVAHLTAGFNGWAEAGGAVVDAHEKSEWTRTNPIS
ncbi:MAG: rhodanese-like domain-containing protein [Ilumatobacteraceae bacterium]